MKSRFTEPKIYTGGVNITQWSKLSKSEQNQALKRDWYVYYSFRHPITQKKVRQNVIKGGVNRLKTKRERIKFLKLIQRNLLLMLEKGFNPYEYNKELEISFFNNHEVDKNSISPKREVEVINEDEIKHTIEEAIELGLKLKKKTLAETTYSRYKSKIEQFKSWLYNNGLTASSNVNLVTKRVVIGYLNYVLEKSSSRNRNNARSDINSMFQLLEDNEIINDNFISRINVLKSIPKRNKTYTDKQVENLFKTMKHENPTLFLFVKFICYNFLRPIEICRLRIKDIDLEGATLSVKAKSKANQTMRIPNVLLKDLQFIKQCNTNAFLFAEMELGSDWDAKDESKRDYYTKQFKIIKDSFDLDVNYGLYSFRHTFITKAYRNLRKTLTPFEAKSKLMTMTRHSSMDALEKYLRTIDAELPQDYSEHLI
jgi:integrase